MATLRKRQNDLGVRSLTDALTNLANRGWLEEQLQERFNQSREQGATLLMVFIDLDYFKVINDEHGH
ncbi:GGDEF domain-containing protein [Halomonas sp. GFAJ-1]|uniref:GGDEF domain-containing protein n=1 Tax=Halomonas sp. GFAJ-1 TaxID=1118153 RepID=UPI00023A37FA|nr:diguanylate cyclase [Halomonas sp. GFAJ-1]EHK62660.1 response regulator receiver modulated diguanylate cyclase [Halomonas sp. GFAJ-1]